MSSKIFIIKVDFMSLIDILNSHSNTSRDCLSLRCGSPRQCKVSLRSDLRGDRQCSSRRQCDADLNDETLTIILFAAHHRLLA